MKSPKRNCLGGTVGLATLSVFLSLTPQAQPVFANSDACCPVKALPSELNRGYLSTPKAREEIPWLTRNATTLQTPMAAKAAAATVSNRALANSPRYREEHFEALRPEGTYLGTAQFTVPSEIAKNAALAASPRGREEFPALQRKSALEDGDKIQIAPLK